MTTRVYYDGDCPFCANYVSFTRLKAAVGDVALINLRDVPERRHRFLQDGLDPDKGMIVETEGQTYHGADAMNVLSLMSTGRGFFNAVTSTIFRHRVLANALYPAFRAGRNATVMLLGSERLEANDAAREAQYQIFARFLGLFAILHALYYLFRGAPGQFEPTSIPMMILGAGMIFAPQARSLFVGLILVLAVDGWVHAPTHSNHTILLNFFVVTVLAAGLWHTFRGSSWSLFFRDVQPIGRCLLLIMYTFGIFHKINTGFLDPAVSCAVVLWREMPAPLVWIDFPAMHYLAIYGTFVVEGVIMLMLILPKWRHLGICAGIGFHSLLALSGYAMYPVFSTLAIVMHTLFISRASAMQVTRSAEWQHFDRRLRSVLGLALLLVAVALIGLFALLRDYNTLAFVWLFLVMWPLAIIAVTGGADPESDANGPQFRSPLLFLNIITLLFFLNAFSPYLGLKTAQSMNMFANLRLEGGVSNHLVFPNPPGPFVYLEDVVEVIELDGQPVESGQNGEPRYGLVYYEFIAMLETLDPALQISYLRNGELQITRSAGEILATDRGILHAPWIRKIFHFEHVYLDLPRQC